MPTFNCPIDGCIFVTDDVGENMAVAMLQLHGSVVHPANPRAKGPRMERPRIDSNIEPVAWNNFIRRWDIYRTGSSISNDAAPLQLFECGSARLCDMVLKVDPDIATRDLATVRATMHRLAVVPVAISVMRAELLQFRQAPDEPFRSFNARVQGKAETCSFASSFTCTCGVEAPADYTVEMTRDVLLAGIADTDIRREVLGTTNVHRILINEVIALVEAKEMARDALPSASHAAMSMFKQHGSNPQMPCHGCGQPYFHFTKMRNGSMNTVPHKVCKTCHFKQGRAKRNGPPVTALSKSNAIGATGEADSIIASATAPSSRRRRDHHGQVLTLDHHIFSAGEWRRAKLLGHPRVIVDVSIAGKSLHMCPNRSYTASVHAVTDSGAQSNIWSLKSFDAAGFPRSALFPVSLNLKAANSSNITIHGAFFAKIDGTARDGSVVSCQAMIYVSDQVNGLFLSYDAMVDLLIVNSDFPSIGDAKPDTVPLSGLPKLVTASKFGINAGCSDESSPEECDCPQREAVPPLPDKLPFECTPDNNALMKQWLLDRYAASTFNTCPHRPLPCMSGPPVEIHIAADATPRTCHIAAPVPLHWQRQVYEDLLRDEALGVIERVPYGQPVTWCHRMVVTRKHDGKPRRTVDLSPLNKFCQRETFSSESPFHLARRIPGNTWKTVTDAWNGYHSVPLRKSDRHLTTFITPFGRWQYTRAPQGFLSSGDGYNRRFDAIISNFERKERCVDDTIHFDEDLEQHWWRTMKFLSTVGNAGIVLNSTKFQFAERTVNFAGFCVSESSIIPLAKFVDAITHFPTPSSTTDVRSWFGLINQVGNYAQLRDVMAPFRPYLSPKFKFQWTPELDAAFVSSKKTIVQSIRHGVEIFDGTKRTCLRPDFSERGIGYFLLQQHCKCSNGLPGCCTDGWKVTLAGSRFLHSAEQRYAPVEGEALAVAWSLEQTRYFTQGCNDLVVVTDHKPLVKIFGDRTLDEITNSRLFRLKQRTLPWHFTMAHLAGKTNLAADATSRHPSPTGHIDAFLQACGDADLGDVSQSLTSIQPGADDNEYTFLAAVRQDAQAVTSLSWTDIATATKNDAAMSSLIDTIVVGFPEDHKDLPHAVPFWRYRDSLYVSHGVVMFDDRVVIPPALRRQVLDNLHAAHQGKSTMELRARSIVFWPGMTFDIGDVRARCDDCNRNAPSQASLPSSPACPPSVPFESVVADYFNLAGRHYLVIADRLSGWVEIFATPSGSYLASAQGLIDRLRTFMAIFGVPEELSSDGGPEFAASTTADFLKRWGVRHRVSSAYNAQSNGRAEVAVKSAKRLLRANTDPAGLLDSDLFLRAILQLRNSPDPDCGKSPAEIVFGRPLRDTLSFAKHLQKFGRTIHLAPAVHPSWREAWAAKEVALRDRFVRQSDNLNTKARYLPPLVTGDKVFIQNQTSNSPRRWDKSGEVVDVGANDQYVIKVAGSGRLTTRNRRFLRRFQPVMPSGREPTLYASPSPSPSDCGQLPPPPLPPLLTLDMPAPSASSPAPSPLVALPAPAPFASPMPVPSGTAISPQPPLAQSLVVLSPVSSTSTRGATSLPDTAPPDTAPPGLRRSLRVSRPPDRYVPGTSDGT